MKCIDCAVYRKGVSDSKFCRGVGTPEIDHSCVGGESITHGVRKLPTSEKCKSLPSFPFNPEGKGKHYDLGSWMDDVRNGKIT